MRTPPKTPFTFVDRDRRARTRERGENFNVTVSRTQEVRYRRTRGAHRTCPTIVLVALVKSGDFTTYYLAYFTTRSPSATFPSVSLSLFLSLSTRDHVCCHRRRCRSEKEVNARERVSLGKELGQEPMVRSARWSDRF